MVWKAPGCVEMGIHRIGIRRFAVQRKIDLPFILGLDPRARTISNLVWRNTRNLSTVMLSGNTGIKKSLVEELRR